MSPTNTPRSGGVWAERVAAKRRTASELMRMARVYGGTLWSAAAQPPLSSVIDAIEAQKAAAAPPHSIALRAKEVLRRCESGIADKVPIRERPQKLRQIRALGRIQCQLPRN